MGQPSHSIPDAAGAGGQNDPGGIEDEFRLLTADEGRRLLEEVAGIRSIGPADLARLRKSAPARSVSAAVRLALARRKAAGKFERGAEMWVEPVGVEQATAEPVARYKAWRFQGAPIVVDLCAGIGGDALALAEHSRVITVDLDAGMCRRLRWNAGVYGVADNILAVRARAESFPIPDGARVHLDPDRRAGRDRRARALEDYAPGPAFWESLIERVPGGAIKLSPAADFERLFPPGRIRPGGRGSIRSIFDLGSPGGSPSRGWAGPPAGCEVELISLGGECKEATVWFGDLAGCRRRATRLPEQVTWTDRDATDPGPSSVSVVSDWIFDPDPSLIRAGLLDGFARSHGLSRIAEGVDYLSGPEPMETAFLSAFAVREVASLDLKHLRRMIERHDVGTLEIKVRGVDVTPESLRARLKPRGSQPATLLIVGGPGPARAVLARRAPAGA